MLILVKSSSPGTFPDVHIVGFNCLILSQVISDIQIWFFSSRVRSKQGLFMSLSSYYIFKQIVPTIIETLLEDDPILSLLHESSYMFHICYLYYIFKHFCFIFFTTCLYNKILKHKNAKCFNKLLIPTMNKFPCYSLARTLPVVFGLGSRFVKSRSWTAVLHAKLSDSS
jgi:hypothetical protein